MPEARAHLNLIDRIERDFIPGAVVATAVG